MSGSDLKPPLYRPFAPRIIEEPEVVKVVRHKNPVVPGGFDQLSVISRPLQSPITRSSCALSQGQQVICDAGSGIVV